MKWASIPQALMWEGPFGPSWGHTRAEAFSAGRQDFRLAAHALSWGSVCPAFC